MRGAAKLYSSPAVFPTKYHSFIVETSEVKQSETWDVELPATNAVNAVLYLSNSTQGELRQVSLSAILHSEQRRKATTLPVKFKSLNLKDDSGKTVRARIYYALLPKSNTPQRVRVQSVLAGKSLEKGLALPHDTPVERATLVVHNRKSSLAKLSIKNEGFRYTKNTDKPSRTTYIFELNEPWKGAADANQSHSVPKVITSFNTWEEIARRHAFGYREEMNRSLDAALEPFRTAASNPTQTVHQILKWIGENISYQSAGTTFAYDSKFGPRPIREIINSRKGNCRDQALILMKALSLAGISSEPVEVSLAEGYGAVPIESTIPRDFQFNHVIVYVPELDEYFDPTLAVRDKVAMSYKGAHSVAFARSYGLHLFTTELRHIRPELIQKEITVRTTIAYTGSKWGGMTKWEGKNEGLVRLATINERRDQQFAEGKTYDAPFIKNHLKSQPDTWKFKQNDETASGTVQFAYAFTRDPVDDEGKLLWIPKNIMTQALLKFDEPEDMQTFGGYCFGANRSAEIIEIRDIRTARIPNELMNVKLTGEDGNFTQTIELKEGHLTLAREYASAGNCAFHTDRALARQQAFFREIKRILNATHAPLQ